MECSFLRGPRVEGKISRVVGKMSRVQVIFKKAMNVTNIFNIKQIYHASSRGSSLQHFLALHVL